MRAGPLRGVHAAVFILTGMRNPWLSRDIEKISKVKKILRPQAGRRE